MASQDAESELESELKRGGISMLAPRPHSVSVPVTVVRDTKDTALAFPGFVGTPTAPKILQPAPAAGRFDHHPDRVHRGV